MKDPECVRFLRWALPRLRMRWPGYRKVRRQVCKRITRRVHTLGLAGLAHYREYLETTPEEWSTLDSLCRVTISRFYRDRIVFDHLCDVVAPCLAEQVRGRGANRLDAWSIGCASGEEPYTLAIGLILRAETVPGQLPFNIIASDADPGMVLRAQAACYDWSSVKALPRAWLRAAFDRTDDGYCLRSQYRERVRFLQQDIRAALPDGHFDVVLCRNLVFTYFDAELQSAILEKLLVRLRPGGALAIGKHESLPAGGCALAPWFPKLGIYRRESH
ncbi:MAG: CheR family methyltransferase [Acidiferrobacterales bacterium]